MHPAESGENGKPCLAQTESSRSGFQLPFLHDIRRAFQMPDSQTQYVLPGPKLEFRSKILARRSIAVSSVLLLAFSPKCHARKPYISSSHRLESPKPAFQPETAFHLRVAQPVPFVYQYSRHR